MDLRELDLEEVVNEVTSFLETKYKESGVDKYIVGLSGGLDSSVASTLCKEAVGAENVLGLHLSINKKIDLAKKHAESLGIEFEELNLSTDYREIFNTLKKDCNHFKGKKVPLGNIKARLRMLFLYYHSNSLNGLVVGTGNKSEWEVGYFTKYGDGAADVFPLIGLFKTEVKELAKYLDLPDEIIEKKPSAGLWEGQTDEEELGISYEEMDPVIYALNRDWSRKRIRKELDISSDKVEKVIKLMNRCNHKKEPASMLEF